ncbi:rapamycin-insensitive companion of mTOR [Parasteatoda tepidariorum]
MANRHSFRQTNKLGGKYLRRRRDSEEDNIYLDLNKDAIEVVREILFNVVNQEVTVTRKLGYLNGFVKFCLKEPDDFGFSYKDIFCCLRLSLFHETCEVRAAGLRACRYLLQNVKALEAFLQIKLQFLVSRSLDILLDNRIERIQALRLMRKVLSLDPQCFPQAFSNCLVSVVNEGAQERDMLRPCLATLSQLALLNPRSCIEAHGVNALVQNVVENTQIQASEAVLGVVFHLINHPKTRLLMRDKFGLENLLAPFTDCHYRFPNSTEGTASEDKDPNLNCSKSAIVCALLSWPGLIYLCQTGATHLQSLVEMLHLPYPELRKNILDIFYQLFDINIPEWTDDFSVALCSSDPSAYKTSWQLYEGYIVSEGTDILSYSSKDRMNLVDNYYSLLVLIFVSAGLLDALCDIIVTSEICLAVRATIFLGEFVYMANQLLPIDCSHLSNCLPSLISSASTFGSSKEHIQATAAITCLFRIHELKKKGAVPNSLVLHNIIHICDPSGKKKGFLVSAVNKIKLWKYLKKEMTDGIDQAIKDTQVITKDFNSWDWDLIDCILKNPSDHLKKLEDANHRLFIKKLLHFFKPSSKDFSEMEFDKENGKQICVTGCHLLEFFLELEEARAQECFDEFLSDLNVCLVQLIQDSDRLNSILSPMKVSGTYAQMYFLFIGKLSSTHKGCKFLNRCNTFQNLLQLVNVTNQDIYIKLVVSSLDYSKEGFSRAILAKVLTGTEEATRLYATNLLLVLLRAKLPDFRKWAIEVLVYQLHDSSKLVSSAALEILDEACTIKENLEALISLRPPLLQLGDKGLLLLIRYLSVQSGFNFLKESNFLSEELRRWQYVYNFKYVKVVEDLLNEAFTHHRRSDDGNYGRRSTDMSHTIRKVYLPPHIYGQLVQHLEGIEVLEAEVSLHDLFTSLHNPSFDSELDILNLKASLWAVGHIGSYPLGVDIIIRENLIQVIVNLAASAPVFSIRGTCHFVLGLISSTPEGAAALGELGWEAVRRNHDEKWPLIKEELFFDTSKVRKSTWSFSSMSYDFPTGALPTNLSFVVRHSPYSFSDSRNSSYSSLDALQNSLDRKQFAGILPHHKDFNDHDSSSDDGRPRSSSDCQSDPKDRIMFQIAESSSWDTLDTCYSTSPPGFNPHRKRRSISTSEVEMKVFDFKYQNNQEKHDEMDENEESSPSFKSSYPTVSISNANTQSSDHSSEIHANASDSSYNISSKSSDIGVDRPSLLKQLSRGQSIHLHSPESPEKPPFLLTSARDALGYATLKDIQRRRVSSLSFHDPSLSSIDYSIRHMKTKSLDAEGARIFNVAPNDLFFSEMEENSVRHRFSSQEEKTDPDIHYIGISLPSNLSSLFDVSITILILLNISSQSQSPNDVFEFHSEENCLLNHAFNDKKSLQSTTIDEESEDNQTSQIKATSESVSKKPIILDRSNSIRSFFKCKDETVNSQYLIRKEAMRYVTNLCSSVAVKASEQGLLNLKQKFPTAFQDICLYSEICYYISNYNFRLTARRFLQELFLDVTFEQLQWEAESIVSIISIPQVSGSEV